MHARQATPGQLFAALCVLRRRALCDVPVFPKFVACAKFGERGRHLFARGSAASARRRYHPWRLYPHVSEQESWDVACFCKLRVFRGASPPRPWMSPEARCAAALSRHCRPCAAVWQLMCRHVQLRDGVSAEYLWVRDASANCIDVAPVSHGARSPMSASLRCSADPSCEVLALGRATRDVSCPRRGASSAPRCFSLHCTPLASASFAYVAAIRFGLQARRLARCACV